MVPAPLALKASMGSPQRLVPMKAQFEGSVWVQAKLCKLIGQFRDHWFTWLKSLICQGDSVQTHAFRQSLHVGCSHKNEPGVLIVGFLGHSPALLERCGVNASANMHVQIQRRCKNYFLLIVRREGWVV
jgi:hypothetical protein